MSWAAALLLLVLAGSAMAQGKVWRCTDAQGRTVYQDTACAAAATEAKPVQAADPREPAAVAEAQRRAQAEQALGEKMAQERREVERKAAQQRPIQLAGPTAAAASAASASTSRRRQDTDRQRERGKSAAKDSRPETGPAFRPPGSLQKTGPASP